MRWEGVVVGYLRERMREGNACCERAHVGEVGGPNGGWDDVVQDGTHWRQVHAQERVSS